MTLVPRNGEETSHQTPFLMVEMVYCRTLKGERESYDFNV